jgi:hypothetical protein
MELSCFKPSATPTATCVDKTRNDRVGGWYASFVKMDHWKLNLVNGSDRDKVDRIFSEYYDSTA